MVLGFFKHVYRYFNPEEEKPRVDTTQSSDGTQMIPCYNAAGEIFAYQAAINRNNNFDLSSQNNVPALGAPFHTMPPQSSFLFPPALTTLGAHAPGPLFHPYPWGPAYNSSEYSDLRNPPPLRADWVVKDASGLQESMTLDRSCDPFIPPSPSLDRPPVRARTASVSSSSSSNHFLPSLAHSLTSEDGKSGSKSTVRVEWHPWPDGNLERDFTWPEFHATGGLPVHWACESTGSDKRGSDTADEWWNGKRTGRRCRGIIRCKNKATCSIIVRPQTRTKGIEQQVLQPCRCGGKLKHYDCRLVSTLYSFSGGVHYSNGGDHGHQKPTHILHLTSREREKFTKIVQDYPKVGPLSLLVGRPGLHGPEKSVAKISSVLFNKDRIKSERRAVKRQGDLPNSDFAEFAEFEKAHPGFVISSQFGAVTVISMQTPFMASQLVKNHIIQRDAINGIVSDGAHGYFLEHKAILLMSSSYCLDLDGWVPGIMSYANGGTQEHFFLHFLSMFESMASQAEKEGRKITDAAFKNVVDFSDAERLGFIQAFVTFWLRRKDDHRTEKELRKDGGALLKGCQQHSRAQVNRIKKISAVVHPGLREAFVNQAMSLIEATDYPDFMERVELLVKQFPKVEGWVGWWARECHAKMLFKPFREMPVQEWDSIPNTTNPAESQHFKIYSALGKKHQLIPGLRGLHQLAQHYELLAAAVSAGIKIRYGVAEHWKHGKRSSRNGTPRTPRKDGRPPDTPQALLGSGRKGQDTAQEPPADPPEIEDVVPDQRPSYRWKENSCYLDTSLELIFQTVSRDFHRQFGVRGVNVDKAEPIAQLLQHMSSRRTTERDLSGGISPEVLQKNDAQRDSFRKFLKQSKLVPDPYAYNPLFAWLEAIVTNRRAGPPDFAQSYFQHRYIQFRTCAGDEQTPEHFRIKRAITQGCFILTRESNQIYRGDVEKWFRELILIRPGEKNRSCWRNIDDDGEASCSGAAALSQIILGIPVMLIFEVAGLWDRKGQNQWNFPVHISPLSLGAEALNGVVYVIVGRAFTNGGHFKAIFTPDDINVYEYDDMANQGCSILISGARIRTHLAGKISPKSNWRTHAVVYRLRRGTRAQSFFSKSQVKAAQRVHGIQFAPTSEDDPPYTIPDITGLDIPNTIEMNGADRFWLNNPHRTDMLDFISSRPPQKKRVRFKFADGENDSNDDLAPPPAKRSRRNKTIFSDDESVPETPETSTANDSSASAYNKDDDDEIEFNCRYGQQGGKAEQILPELCITCTVCNMACHIACQRNGRASSAGAKKSFQCDYCLPPSVILGVNRQECVFCRNEMMLADVRDRFRPKKRKKKGPDAPPRTSLSKRLAPGKGALARYGIYWYPVRLILRGPDGWIVQWWRGNRFMSEDPPSNKVPGADLRDELWANPSARRQIRLGKWTHACETPTEDDLVFEFREAPYTEEIEDTLRPHLYDLQRLHADPDGDHPSIPAAIFSKAQKGLKMRKGSETLRNGGVPFTGELRSIDCARIANWFYRCVPGAKDSVADWMGRVPLAHAYTILIAYRNQEEILAEIQRNRDYADTERQLAIFNIAWRYQTSRPALRFVDVDHECLGFFEERLFENSMRAGRAGNQQWGLDMGPHQDSWNPYANIPTHWNHEDRDENDSELEFKVVDL
ncbi:hypothetical protein FB451DRAFT_1467183 [Mycena latifolia]|nr:hypothetical protein FB451DRAFT_1467183 [Mycena latifolia]